MVHSLAYLVSEDETRGELRLTACRYALRLLLGELLTKNSLHYEYCDDLFTIAQYLYSISNGETRGKDEASFHSCVDACLDMLNAGWNRLSADVLNARNIVVQSVTAESSSDHLDDVDDTNNNNGSSSSSSSRSHRNNNRFEPNNDKSVKTIQIYLESLIFLTGTLRMMSTDETFRRRLTHLGIVEKVVMGLSTCGSSATVITSNSNVDAAAALIELPTNLGEGKNNLPEVRKSESVNAIRIRTGERKIVERLSGIAVQLTAVLRNYCGDSSGRNQMLSTNAVVALCRTLRSFKLYPDCVLNCARVTAKLSLYEPFRGQINKKPANITFLADVIIAEAKKCEEIMKGGKKEANGDDDEDEEEEEWPAWNTWPVLSRIAFTLGNLTTSNDANRLVKE